MSALSLPSVISQVIEGEIFSTQWYRFFQGVFQSSPNTSSVQLVASGIVPGSWVECNGQAISRTRFPDLFSAIGVAYGAGDGLTTFNVPNWASPGSPAIYVIKL